MTIEKTHSTLNYQCSVSENWDVLTRPKYKLWKFDFYRNQYIFVVQGPPNFLNCDLLTPNHETTESLLVMESLPIKTKIAGIIGPPHIFRSKQSCILVNPLDNLD